MTDFEEYKQHIHCTHNAFCQVVIRHAAIDAARRAHKRWEREISLDHLGARAQRYRATEINKFAILTTQANYPRTLQLGEAFQVREEGWC